MQVLVLYLPEVVGMELAFWVAVVNCADGVGVVGEEFIVVKENTLTSPDTDILLHNDVLFIDMLFGSDFSDGAIVEDVSKLDLSGEVIPETDILLDNDVITDDIILLADDVIPYDIILLDNDVITDGFHVDLNDDVFVGFTVSDGFHGNVEDVMSIDILFGSDFSVDAIVEDVSRRDVSGEVVTYDVIVWDDLGVVVEDNGGLGFFDKTLVGRDMEVIFVLSVAVADPLVVAAFVDTPCAVDCFV